MYTNNDSINPGACGVLLSPWAVPLWSVDGPKGFCFFKFVHLQLLKMYLIQYVKLLHNVFHAIRYNVSITPCIFRVIKS